MIDPITVNIKGLDELQAKLESLTKKAADKILGAGLTAAAQPILDEMVREVPKDSGFLAKHIHAKLGRKVKNDMARAIFIGPDKDEYYPAKEEK